MIPQPQAGDLTPGYWERTPLPEMGLATYYSPGLMDWVLNYRQVHGEVPDCPECVGSVAMLRAGDIGRKVWLQPPGGELAGPFLVVDCAHTDDVAALVERNWVIDVSFDLGQLWGMNRPLDGVVVWADPAEEAAPPAKIRPTPFYIDPRDVVVSAPTPTAAPAEPTPTMAWPTRRPLPLAPATPEPARQPRFAPGTATITVPTRTPDPNAPPQTPTPELIPSPLPGEEVASVAIGRAGSGLLQVAVPRRSPTATAVPGVTPTATPTRDPLAADTHADPVDPGCPGTLLIEPGGGVGVWPALAGSA